MIHNTKRWAEASMLEALSLLDSMLCWSATSGQNVSRGSLMPGTSPAPAPTAKGSQALATFSRSYPPDRALPVPPSPKSNVMLCLQREGSKQERT